MDYTCQSPLSSTVSQNLLKFMSIESVMPLTISPSVIAFSSCLHFFPASGSLPWGSLLIRLPKYWNFSFSISPPTEYSKLISFRMEGFDLLEVQESLKSLFQPHNSKASILLCSVFMVQLSNLYMTTGKTIDLTIWTFIGKVMSLFFNMLTRFIIAFTLHAPYWLWL